MLYRTSTLIILSSFLAAAACGGKQEQRTTTKRPGESHVGDDLDVGKGLSKNPDAAADAGVGAGTTDGGAPVAVTPDAGLPADAPLVTFRLKNSTDKDIELNLNKGWGIVIFAYTGVRGKGAKGIVMFPRHCTAACSVDKADRCPVCTTPKGTKEKDAQKREVIAPGKHLDVPWKGEVYAYKKTRGARWSRCECHEVKQVKDDTYTVEAYGLHITTSAKKRSKLQRAKAAMTINGKTPQVVELDFPAQPAKP